MNKKWLLLWLFFVALGCCPLNCLAFPTTFSSLSLHIFLAISSVFFVLEIYIMIGSV